MKKLISRSLEYMYRKVEGVPDVPTTGVTNELDDGYFVFMADYDNVFFRKVLKDLQLVNSVYGLCTFVILCNHESAQFNEDGDEEAVGNYNVIGLDKLTWRECLHAIHLTRCDSAFKGHVIHCPRRNWVVRIIDKFKDGRPLKPKPKLKMVYSFSAGKCKKGHSTQFRSLLEAYFDAKLPRLRNWDGITAGVEIIPYKTKEKG